MNHRKDRGTLFLIVRLGGGKVEKEATSGAGNRESGFKKKQGILSPHDKGVNNENSQ